MKKAVFKLSLGDDDVKTVQKAMKAAAGISGVISISIDIGNQKLTVVGTIDPIIVGAKLRELCATEVISVGPARWPDKKEKENITNYNW